MKPRASSSSLVALAFLVAVAADTQAAVYVSQARGSNQSPGTKEKPVKEIDRAVVIAAAGDTIYVAGGTYTGTFGIGYIESDKPLKLIGSYDETFSARNIVETPTVFQPTNEAGGKARKAFLKLTRAIDGTLIDGIVFDMGYRNAYSPKDGLVAGLDTGRMLRATERPASGNSTVEEPIIQVVSAAQGGDLTIRNCIFVNGSSFAIQAGLRQGTFRILNNVFAGNRMAAIEIYGTCASKGDPGRPPDQQGLPAGVPERPVHRAGRLRPGLAGQPVAASHGPEQAGPDRLRGHHVHEPVSLARHAASSRGHEGIRRSGAPVSRPRGPNTAVLARERLLATAFKDGDVYDG